MTTERERLERQWRRQNKSRPPKSYPRRKSSRNSFQDKLIIAIGLVSVLLVLRHFPNLLNLSKVPQITQLNFSSQFVKTYSQNPIKPPSLKIGNGQLLEQYNFTPIDRLGASLNYQGSSVQELANQLKSRSKTDADKARIIYSWITHHIDYNFSGFLTGHYGDVSPEGVLSSRKGVCSGYANLFQALAQKMGLEAYVIEGYAKGYGYAVGNSMDINHAWNAVKIDNAWFLIDSTWGAGYINNNQFVKKPNPFYFATNPTQFIYNHLPSDDDWQLLHKKYSKEQFEQLPEISPAFFEYGLNTISHKNHTIQASINTEIVLRVPDNIVIASDLSSDNSSFANSILIQKEQSQTRIHVAFPSAGTYKLNIYAKPKNQAPNYDHAISYRLIASQSGELFPTTYKSFSDNQVNLEAPLQKTLPANQSVYFKLHVPSAQDVQVISQRSSQWTPLSGSGDSFAGTVPIEPGKVMVIARFPNQSSYQSLIEYDAR
jgi:transglutaminase/protease-like cytokinesis protein 3